MSWYLPLRVKLYKITWTNLTPSKSRELPLSHLLLHPPLLALYLVTTLTLAGFTQQANSVGQDKKKIINRKRWSFSTWAVFWTDSAKSPTHSRACSGHAVSLHSWERGQKGRRGRERGCDPFCHGELQWFSYTVSLHPWWPQGCYHHSSLQYLANYTLSPLAASQQLVVFVTNW